MPTKRRKRAFGCASLLFGAILTACVIILFSEKITGYFNIKNIQEIKTAAFVIIVIFLFCFAVRVWIFFSRKYSLRRLDDMDGHDFEYACADILKMNGFKKVRVTQGSGDFGVDITAEKGGKKYAVQCKRYNHKLDNKPIQEVKTGLAYYGCDIGAVMTNQTFTEPAKSLAQANEIELWDRSVLEKMIRKRLKLRSNPADEYTDEADEPS